ncbi:hypothetical protein ABZ905_36775 [Streptomyces parvus]|uniref:hypothetical protein n=1 Tax=Streptomyces parvus TaxID=66428 RepID=UPI0033D9AAFA
MINAVWIVDGAGAGSCVAIGPEEAAQQMIRELHPWLDRMGPESAAHVLGAVLHPARLAAATDGRTALSADGFWEYSGPGVFVRMSVADA